MEPWQLAMKHPNLSIIIVAGNEAETIVGCLKSAAFADEIILVKNLATTQKTLNLAKRTCPDIKIVTASKTDINFGAWHNLGAKTATSTWQLHLDCDERIPETLQKEIKTIINNTNNHFTSFDIPRANYFLGCRVKNGGTYPDYVKRLFKTENFIDYSGTLHEQPTVTGTSSVLKNDLLHFTHRDLVSMLEKSLKWTSIEAELLHQSRHPPVVWWRFLRMMFTKLWERLILQSMWRDGIVGFISVIFETFDTFIIYARLWEIQQHESRNL